MLKEMDRLAIVAGSATAKVSIPCLLDICRICISEVLDQLSHLLSALIVSLRKNALDFLQALCPGFGVHEWNGAGVKTSIQDDEVFGCREW